MKPHHTPTVFVAMVLTPNQIGLFEEIEAEAKDVRGEPAALRSVLSSERGESVFLEYERINMVLSWSKLPDTDILTIAIGPRSEMILGTEEARNSAGELRELVERSEALFEVTRSIWQITLLPLNLDTVRNHLDRLEVIETPDQQGDTPFIDLECGELPDPTPPSYVTKAGGLFESLRASFKTANEEPSWAMQASALALSSTFVLVTPPVGIAMFTYAALRQGTEMDLLPRELNMSGWAAAGLGKQTINKRGLKVSIVADAM